MQIQVMSRLRPDDESDPAGFVMAGLKETSNGYPIVHADAYAVDGLVGILDVRAARGEREILVMGCSREQIQAVLEWQSETDELVDLEDLVIHLVRKDPTERNAG
ncbi:hypothetical protein [Pseudomonas syringae]|uniref:Uncharacterized protein n=1 Tax=Pseudomonas syringae TaxID=317 RepID=A0A085V4C0_PSESX|nr:hypothetical protein [Pseudomonas syringae]KFE50283.1 hypothetical protein IV02_17805 [Pseudomonas syringae]